MEAYTRHEKQLAMMLADLLEATDAVLYEMKRGDWAITADHNQRVIYQRLNRSSAELTAAKHFVARMQSAPTAMVRPARPLEDTMLPDPLTKIPQDN